MTDINEEETFEIDPEHPWVEASVYFNPQPVPSSVQMNAVTIMQEGKPVPAVMMSVVDITGIKNVFMPFGGLQQLMQQGADLLAWHEQEKSKGLIVAPANIMDNLREQFGNMGK